MHYVACRGSMRRKTTSLTVLPYCTWRDEISLIKVAYLMLNFLNLKSFFRHLFFLGSILPEHGVLEKKRNFSQI